MPEKENQMGLFEMAGAAPDRENREPKPAPSSAANPSPSSAAKPSPPSPAKPAPSSAAKPAPPAPTKQARKNPKPPVAVSERAAKKVSGLVPDGDVRLTANIRQDLHLKLKIASAYRRTTIGEIIEELLEKYI